MALDRSLTALRIARRNARTHRVDTCIQWFCGNWDAALSPAAAPFDLIVSNPPYIRSADMATLQPEIHGHEPTLALDGSADGLACLRRILASVYRHLRIGGLLAMEMGWNQADEVRAIAAGVGRYGPVRVVKDYSGLDRVAILERINYKTKNTNDK